MSEPLNLGKLSEHHRRNEVIHRAGRALGAAEAGGLVADDLASLYRGALQLVSERFGFTEYLVGAAVRGRLGVWLLAHFFPLKHLLVECGLESPNVLAGSGEATPAEDLLVATAGIENQTRMVRALLPQMREHQIAPEADIDAFEEHAAVIRREVAEGRRTHYRIAGHGVWASKPLI